MLFRAKGENRVVLNLHNLRIALESDSEDIRQEWQALFTGWLAEPGTPPGDVEITFQLQLRQTLPPRPQEQPFFRDKPDHLPDETGILAVYRLPDGFVLLHYLDGALVTVPLQVQEKPVVRGILTHNALQVGRFEDITFTSLAPVLRRRGYYLVHAFAASKERRCAMLIGPTGSGKTTTGLALLLQGWQLLANDVLLLAERDGVIFALPTPGIFGIRPFTFTLLPQLRTLLPAGQAPSGMCSMPSDLLVNGRWSAPLPVTHLYFPCITEKAYPLLQPQNRAIALANLMGESVDRWDEEALPAHMAILQKLARQASPYALYLGREVAEVPQLLLQSP